MKEVAGNTTVNENSFPRYLMIGDIDITEKSLMAKNLNNLFVNAGLKSVSVILSSRKTFQTFLSGTNTVLNGAELTEKRIPKYNLVFKNDKCYDFHELHVNVIKFVFNEIKTPLSGTPLIMDHFQKKRKLQGYTNLQNE